MLRTVITLYASNANVKLVRLKTVHIMRVVEVANSCANFHSGMALHCGHGMLALLFAGERPAKAIPTAVLPRAGTTS